MINHNGKTIFIHVERLKGYVHGEEKIMDIMQRTKRRPTPPTPKPEKRMHDGYMGKEREGITKTELNESVVFCLFAHRLPQFSAFNARLVVHITEYLCNLLERTAHCLGVKLPYQHSGDPIECCKAIEEAISEAGQADGSALCEDQVETPVSECRDTGSASANCGGEHFGWIDPGD